MPVERAYAEDSVRPSRDERLGDAREVAGAVLEVGVEDRRELAPRGREARPDRGALALVAAVREKAHPRLPAERADALGCAVGRAVVDDD